MRGPNPVCPCWRNVPAISFRSEGKGRMHKKPSRTPEDSNVSSFVHTDRQKKLLTCGNNVPEVGLELASEPCQRWELPETCGIRSSPRTVVPDRKPRLWTMSTPLFAPEIRPVSEAGMPGRFNWLVAQRPPALTCRKNGPHPLPRRTPELLMCSGLWTFRKFQPHPRASWQLFQPARYHEPEQFDICSSS